MGDLTRDEFINEVVKVCLDEKLLSYKLPTREELSLIFAWMEKYGIVADDISKVKVKTLGESFIQDTKRISLSTKVHAMNIFHLFMDEYPRLRDEYATIKKSKSNQKIHEATSNHEELPTKWLTSEVVWPEYLDTLLATPGLWDDSKRQLYYIKAQSLTMIKSGYDLTRVSVIDGSIAVDGHKLAARDEKERYQTYIEMKTFPSEAHLHYIQSLLELAGAMIGVDFNYPAQWGKILEGEVEKEEITDLINTDNNQKILIALLGLIRVSIITPLCIDSDDSIICLKISNGKIEFCLGRSDCNNWFIPSIEKNTLIKKEIY